MPTFEEPEATSNWETWRDENIIDVCEVNISVEGFFLGLQINIVLFLERYLTEESNSPRHNSFAFDP